MKKVNISFLIYMVSCITIRLIGKSLNLLGVTWYEIIGWLITGSLFSLTLWFIGTLVKNKEKVIGKIFCIAAGVFWVLGFVMVSVDLEDLLLKLNGMR